MKIGFFVRNLSATLLLITVIIVMSALVSRQTNKMESQDCFNTLEQSTQYLINDIKANIKSDENQLQAIANMICLNDETDSSETISLLSSFRQTGIISRLELLLPDNTIITGSGERINADGILSFEEESALGVHISDIQSDTINTDESVLRNFVPIVKDGNVTAILCGIAQLSELPDLWSTSIYDGSAQVYIIDGNTGDFIVDTWHKSLGNIYDFSSRKVKSGYSMAKMQSDQKSGIAGHIVFVSKTTGDYMYYYYSPIGINNWMIGLSVPESVAFENALKIKKILFWFTLAESACFIIYFARIFKSAKNESLQNKKRLQLVSYIYDVEKLLFTAHLKKENIQLALEEISKMTSSGYSFFKLYRNDDSAQVYRWSNLSEDVQNNILSMLENTMIFHNYFSNGAEGLLCKNVEELRAHLSGTSEMLIQLNIHSIAAAPIRNVNDEIIGMLGVMNPDPKLHPDKLIENVTLSFSMLYNNMKSYNTIKEMGETDFLTGLLNRNSYQLNLPKYAIQYNSSLACIYADANGLHELNNTKGHEAGDNLLRTIAHLLREQFGSDNTYRIGGDEFVALSIDEPEEVIVAKINQINDVLAVKNYHSSIGFSYRTNVTSIDDMIKEAEKKMYCEKKKYYELTGNDRRRAH